MPTEDTQFALLRTGVFADGKGTPSYQIITRTADAPWEIATGRPNDPVAYAAAQERLRRWQGRTL